MTEESDVARHYSSGTLLSRIRDGLQQAGLADLLDPDALAPVDEFHVGGRKATVQLLDRLNLARGQRAVDLGCGLGGPARFAAQRSGVAVVGVDLTKEFVATGQELTRMAGLSDRVKHVHASILDLPFEGGVFDAAWMIHVGMNIADKHRIAEQAARVLKPGALFGIYDVMRMSDGDITYPMPWASSPRQSAVVGPDRYRFALQDAGFEIVSETNLAEFALEFYKSAAAKPPGSAPLGLHLVMGEDSAKKIDNMVDNIRGRGIAPYMIIARREG